MDYKLIEESKSQPPSVETLPFLKRAPYEDESEYRIIYVDKENVVDSREWDIELFWIKKITLSPWMPRALSASVKDTLKSIRGCSRLSIVRSTLIENEKGAALLRRRPKGLLRAARQELLDPSKAWWGGRRGRLADRRCYPISVSLGVIPLVLARFVEVPVRIEVAAGS